MRQDRVLFLDIDGVLNHRAVFVPRRSASPLCPHAIERLQNVVKSTDCMVVLSSTWRFLDHHVEKLAEAGGFPNPHDDWRTVQLTGRKTDSGLIIPVPRGAEIAEWLGRHPEVSTYAIVDDDDDMLFNQAAHFVQTSFDHGLLDHHAAQLIAILRGEA